MRRIAVINQKGGVGKTTTAANLGAALAQQGRRVVLIDMDAQANLSLSLNIEAGTDEPSAYSVLTGSTKLEESLRPTALAGMRLLPSNIDLSGAELELASSIGREYLMRDAMQAWESEHRAQHGRAPADYVILDCPPSLGLLSINALAAAGEILITLQTEFLALQGMSKLVEVVQILRRRLNPDLVITGIIPCLYDSRLKLAREVLGEIRKYFPGQVFAHPVRTNVKLAEAPSFGMTIFQYAPDSNGAQDYRFVAAEVALRESRDPDLADLPPFDETFIAPVAVSAKVADFEIPRPAAAPPEATPTRVEAQEVDTSPTAKATPVADATPAGDAAKVHTGEPKRKKSPGSRSKKSPSTAEANDAREDEPPPAEPPAPGVLVPKRSRAKVLRPVAPTTSPPSNDYDRTQDAPAPVEDATRNRRGRSRRTPHETKETAPTTAPVSHELSNEPAPASVDAPTGVVPTSAAPARSAPSPAAKIAGVSAPPSHLDVAIRHAPRVSGGDPARRILRAEDLPPLPPDAFEILNSGFPRP